MYCVVVRCGSGFGYWITFPKLGAKHIRPWSKNLPLLQEAVRQQMDNSLEGGRCISEWYKTMPLIVSYYRWESLVLNRQTVETSNNRHILFTCW